ncbi:MFS transporter [Nocardia aurea]|uniref:MFS transporter n=1 Tax=Nocardia aurea TaxID=2144174 RepID=UPI0033B9E7E2
MTLTGSNLSADPSVAKAAPRWDIIVLCAALAGLTILDLSKVNVALPSIGRDLHADATGMQLVVGAYIVTYALTLVPAGRLGDIRSRKLLMIVALVIYLAAGVGCALAVDVRMLVIARAVQGVAAGMLMPQVLGTMHATLAGADRGRGFGLYGATVNASIALGPVLGGALMALWHGSDSWRAVFWMNIPLGLVALFAVLRFAPRGAAATVTERRGIDPIGLLLFALALVCTLYPFVTTTGGDADPAARWLALIPALILTTAFVYWERAAASRARPPLIEPRLIRESTYRNGIAIAACWFAANLGVVLVITLFLQDGVGLSPLASGLANVTFAIAAGFTSWFGARNVPLRGRGVVVLGIAVTLLGLGATACIGAVAPIHLIAFLVPVTQLIAGAGAGLVVSPNQALSLERVAPELGGTASALTQLGQRVGNSVGVAACGAVYFALLPEGDGSGGVRSAFLGGIAVVGSFMVLALLVAVADLRQRRTSVLPVKEIHP